MKRKRDEETFTSSFNNFIQFFDLNQLYEARPKIHPKSINSFLTQTEIFSPCIPKDKTKAPFLAVLETGELEKA
jgi:hypothetical protein